VPDSQGLVQRIEKLLKCAIKKCLRAVKIWTQCLLLYRDEQLD
jgi:hypothetical protein